MNVLILIILSFKTFNCFVGVFQVSKISATEGGAGSQIAGNFFGSSSAIIDFNSDGINELLVGASGRSPEGAASLLFLNPDGTVSSQFDFNRNNIPSLDISDDFGFSISSTDFNSDNQPEIIVGSPSRDNLALTQDQDPELAIGAIFILFLFSNGTVNTTQIISDDLGGLPRNLLNTDDHFGSAIAALPDIDGDSIPDLLVGASNDDGSMDAGAVYFLSMDNLGMVRSFFKINQINFPFLDLQTGDGFGSSITFLEDFNFDGKIDFAVGTSFGNLDSGAFYILSFENSTTISLVQKISRMDGGFSGILDSDDEFGMALTGINDWNNDGVLDMIATSNGDDDGGVDRGAIYILFLNSNGTVQSQSKISSLSENLQGLLDDGDRFGSSISFLGDINNDLIPDISVGSKFDDDGGSEIGAIYILSLELCGNGLILGNEECDDGNLQNRDGCDNNCVFSEGFICVGQPSVCSSICGDGLIFGGENCDDNNLNNGDGCSSSCFIENGFECAPSTCTEVCGDNQIVGVEQCDDGNQNNGDGCSASCLREDNNLGSSQIAGISVGVILFFCCFIIFTFFGIFWFLKKNRKEEKTDMIELSTRIGLPLLTGIEIKEKLGKGEFGEVFKGEWNSIDVALKTTSDSENFLKEIIVFSELKHPNCLAFFGLFTYENHFMMVTEFMNKGNLIEVLVLDYEITTKELVNFSYQVSLGMQYLHGVNVIHRDLACRNLLVSQIEGVYTIKVADFGLSRQTEDYYRSSDTKVPIRWTAPESISTWKFTQSSDVWSFGIVVWEIFSRGITPYVGHSNQDVIDKVPTGHLILKTPVGMFPQIEKLMRKCWNLDSLQRPTFSEIVNILKDANQDLQQVEDSSINSNSQLNLINKQTENKRGGMIRQMSDSNYTPFSKYRKSSKLANIPESFYSNQEQNNFLQSDDPVIRKLAEENFKLRMALEKA